MTISIHLSINVPEIAHKLPNASRSEHVKRIILNYIFHTMFFTFSVKLEVLDKQCRYKYDRVRSNQTSGYFFSISCYTAGNYCTFDLRRSDAKKHGH